MNSLLTLIKNICHNLTNVFFPQPILVLNTSLSPSQIPSIPKLWRVFTEHAGGSGNLWLLGKKTEKASPTPKNDNNQSFKIENKKVNTTTLFHVILNQDKVKSEGNIHVIFHFFKNGKPIQPINTTIIINEYMDESQTVTDNTMIDISSSQFLTRLDKPDEKVVNFKVSAILNADKFIDTKYHIVFEIIEHDHNHNHTPSDKSPLQQNLDLAHYQNIASSATHNADHIVIQEINVVE